MFVSLRIFFQNYYRQGLLAAIVWFFLAGIYGMSPLTLATTTAVAFWGGMWFWRAWGATFRLSGLRVRRPFANTPRRDLIAILFGILIGLGLTIALVWRIGGGQNALTIFIGWGVLLGVWGGWLGPKVLAWFLKLPWSKLSIHLGWLAGSKLVTAFTLLGVGTGIANVWETPDTSTPSALIAFLVRFIVWVGSLGWVGYRLGLFLLRYRGSIWKWLSGVRSSPRWWMLLGSVLAGVLGVTVIGETAVPAENATLITPNTLLTLLVMGVAGWFVVRWLLTLANPLLKILLQVMLLGMIGGVIVVALLPVSLTSVVELLLAGGLMGAAVALLLYKVSITLLMRGLIGALLGALVAVGNLHNDASQLAVTSWIFVGMIAAVLWSRWRESRG